MQNCEQDRFQLRINCRIFSEKVIKNASCVMLGYCDIQFQDATDGTILAIIDKPKKGTPIDTLVRQYRLELVLAAIQDVAREDHQQIRLLMATAAFSREVTEERITAGLREQIMKTSTPSGKPRITLHCSQTLANGAIYKISVGASPKDLFRILSRMYFLGYYFLETSSDSGTWFLKTEWKTGITQEQWDAQFEFLAIECQKGALTAVYAPVFSSSSLSIV